MVYVDFRSGWKIRVPVAQFEPNPGSSRFLPLAIDAAAGKQRPQLCAT
jgi:hypothetical protein